MILDLVVGLGIIVTTTTTKTMLTTTTKTRKLTFSSFVIRLMIILGLVSGGPPPGLGFWCQLVVVVLVVVVGPSQAPSRLLFPPYAPPWAGPKGSHALVKSAALTASRKKFAICIKWHILNGWPPMLHVGVLTDHHWMIFYVHLTILVLVTASKPNHQI